MKRHFEFNEGKSEKFWAIEGTGNSYTVTYGKTGSTGQKKTKEFDSTDECKKEAEKRIAEKLKKGYAEKKKTAGKTNKTSVKKTSAKKSVKKTAIKKVAKKATAKKADAKKSPEKKTKATSEKSKDMENPIKKTGDLKGGKLDLIMAYYMLDKNDNRKNSSK
jgi:bifunctional non-homologous end joining protein LigD